MHHLFKSAPETNTNSSPAYVRMLLRMYSLYFLSGLIEIELSPEKNLTLLVAEGELASAFEIYEDGPHPLRVEQVFQAWGDGNGLVRSLNLPREAVRSVWQMLDWSPPVEKLTIPDGQLKTQVDRWLRQERTLVIYLEWEQSEGALFIDNHTIAASNTTLANHLTAESGEVYLPILLEQTPGDCEAFAYASLEGTQTYCQYLFSKAMSAWGNSILARYTAMVGSGLTQSLANELNRVMRTRSWYIKVIKDHLYDNHVFRKATDAAQAYRLVLLLMNEHMVKVIGGKLSDRWVRETFIALPKESQEILIQYGLAPGSSFGLESEEK